MQENDKIFYKVNIFPLLIYRHEDMKDCGKHVLNLII